MHPKAVKERTDFLDAMRASYEISISNYTTKINTPKRAIQFLKTKQSNRMFAAVTKIKKDVSLIEPPDINKMALKYFSINNQYINTVQFSIYNFDLTAAYPSILFQDGIISKETFVYLKSISKMERLAAIGMLASKKNIFEVKAGKLISHSVNVSPLENFFWYAVKKVNSIMEEMKLFCGAKFLFYWVDAVYFLADETIKEVMPFILLENHGIESKFEYYGYANIEEKRNYYCVYLDSMNKGGKIFNIPKQQSETSLLLNHYFHKKFTKQ